MIISQAPAKTEKVIYQSVNSFADFNIDNQLKQNILAKGFDTPTPIQDQVINHILEGRDVIGLAGTGTGKTAAFLIPLIQTIFQNKGKALIMAPTRELAVQINTEFKLFAQGMNLYSTLCIGGAPMHRQISQLQRNPDFVIGTPGRLIDLEKRNKIRFRDFNAIVLDEVDQMLDMGFIHDINYVVTRLPNKKLGLFFSATMPEKVNPIIAQFLSDPIRVKVESQRASDNVHQDVIKVRGQSKIDLLHDLLIQDDFEKVLVFGRTKHGLNRLAEILNDRGLRVEAIHGNKSQSQRQRALQKFRDNVVSVLLATDVASRGLDIDDVTHVINYDLPQSYEDYIHRIGRTGRANKTGIALSFV
jgi:superfamily II DNA/RNA helicase